MVASAPPHRPPASSPRLPTLFALGQFRRVVLAGLASGTLRWLELLAIGVFVFAATGRAFDVAWFFFLRMLPMLGLGIAIGTALGYVELRRLYRSALLALACTYLVLFALEASSLLRLWHVGVGCVLSGLFWALDLPLRRLMLMDAVGAERVTGAMGWEAAAQNLTRVVGPFVGGTVFAALGLGGIYLLGSAMAVGLWAYAGRLSPVARAMDRGGAGFVETVREGIGFARGHPLVWLVLASTLVVNMFGFSYATLVPVIAVGSFGVGEVLVGAMMASEGMGAFLGALLIAALRLRRGQAAVYAAACVAFLLAVHLFARSGSYDAALVILFLAGLGIAGFNTMQSAILLMASPPALRPRVMGLLACAIGTMPLGVLALGALSSRLGAERALALWTLIGLVALGAIFAAALLQAWRKRRLSTDRCEPA
ncbi:MAG: MFS transporter [Pseudomonadota bacterium]